MNWSFPLIIMALVAASYVLVSCVFLFWAGYMIWRLKAQIKALKRPLGIVRDLQGRPTQERV